MNRLTLEVLLEVTRRKHGKWFNVECEKYKMFMRSEESFEAAEIMLLDRFEARLWMEDYKLDVRIVEK